MDKSFVTTSSSQNKKKYKKKIEQVFIDLSGQSQFINITNTTIQDCSKSFIDHVSVQETNESLISMMNVIQQKEKYKKCVESIEERQILKPLKKYFKKSYENVKNLEIMYSVERPEIVFHYRSKQMPKKVALKELLKVNKQFGKKQKDIIQQIFNKLYQRVGEEFHKLLNIVDILADKNRVELKINKKDLKPLLYYQIDQKIINFAFFDQSMRIFQFNSKMIEDLQLQKSLDRIWRKFLTSLQKAKGSFQEQLEQYEIESQQQHEQFNETIKQIEKKIDLILNNDIGQFQEDLQKLQKRQEQLKKKDHYKVKEELERISQEIYELNKNIENYRNTQDLVLEEMKGNLTQVYRYRNLLKRLIIAKSQLQSKLPIISRKAQILKALKQDNLIILEGQTGSGKSTQLPQILCQFYKFFDKNPKNLLPILITQPRKLATRTVAERVASQMQQKIGGFVDYTASRNKQISKDAKIIFKLDSIVLDQITIDRVLSKYSCLIIDQAHERTISIDVILGLIKELLQKRSDFKVIVTSASLDGKLMQEYFNKKLIKISGRLYPVQIMYKSINHQPDIVRKIQNVLKKDILVGSSQLRQQYKGDILIFCSGLQEIHTLCIIFQKFLNPRVFKVFGLHGRVSINQQKSVFMKTKQHKLIFASRIAQTSITINGVTVVVDAGYDIQLVYDQKNRVSTRKLINISQSSAKQRAGRAGRTQKGFCFRLYSQVEYSQFRLNKTPQIDNMALDTLVLRLKSLNIQEIFKFPYIKKPSEQGLLNSVETLQMIGGLDFSGKITAIGRLLLQLRIQPFLGRAIVEAILCQYVINKTDILHKRQFLNWPASQKVKLKWICQDIVQIMGMIIYSSNLFYINEKTKDLLDLIKFKNYANEKGDFFYLRNIYTQFMNQQSSNKQNLHFWIKQRHLNKKSLFQAKQLIQQIKCTINLFKIDLKDKATEELINTIKMRMLQCKNGDDVILSCLLMSFCVNLSIYSEDPNIGYTLILQKKPIKIYGTSTLSLQGITPKYIVCYDLKANNKGITYCSIAHQIDYKFLKNIVSDTVFEKLNLKQAQKINPFYQSFQYVLPSLILEQINHEFINRENHHRLIYRYISILINEQLNKLRVSYLKTLAVKDIDIHNNCKNIRQLIEELIKEKEIDKKYSITKFHFMSNIYIEMEHGFKLKHIYFTNAEVQFIITCQKIRLYELTLIFEQMSPKYIGQKLKISTINEEEYKTIKTYLDNNYFTYKQAKTQIKGNSLNSKIYMHFYNGYLKSNPFFLHYKKQNPEKVSQYCQILETVRKTEGIKSKEQKYKYFNLLSKCRFKMSKSKTGIQCYNNEIDCFMLKQAFQHLIVYNVLPFNFKIPTNIRQFRDIETKTKFYDENQWKKEIIIKLQERGYKNLELKVNRNEKWHNNTDDEPVQFTTQIGSQNIEILDNIMKQFDGKQKFVGSGKVHFRYNYKNHIMKINKRLFCALKDDFQYLKEYWEAIVAQLKIQKYEKTLGKVNSVYLSCRSPIRQKLLQPSEKIKELFTPYIIRLDENQFNFLCYSIQGDDFMKQIQEEQDYKVYFGFDKKKSILKLYCQSEELFQDIQSKIFKIFQGFNISTEIISYVGKGLKNVQNAIVKYMDTIQQQKARDKGRGKGKGKGNKSYLQYKIQFKYRQIRLQGDFESLSNVKAQIKKLAHEAPGNCALCLKNTQKPYKLINCGDVFCFKCLGQYIEQFKKEDSLEQIITCPQEACKQCINSNDIRSILSIEEYQSLIHKKVMAFVNKNQNSYIFCPTNGCQQIFQENQIKKKQNFSCYICGKWFCTKCRQPHEHFTCEEWQVKLQKGQLAKFGFIKCKCGAVLQKQNKQKLIKCKACKQSLCWVCRKGWKNQRDCLNHIRSCKTK